MRRAALVTLAVAVPYTAAGLWVDRYVGHGGQLLLGLLTAAVLAGLLLLHPRSVRVQTIGVVGIATVGEVVGSLIWGLYSYRLDNLPAFVPPGHGLVFLCGVSLATLAEARRTTLLAGAVVGATVWGIAGIAVLPARDRRRCDRLRVSRPRRAPDGPTGLRGRLPRSRGARALRDGDRHVDVGGSRPGSRVVPGEPTERRRERICRLRHRGARARDPC